MEQHRSFGAECLKGAMLAVARRFASQVADLRHDLADPPTRRLLLAYLGTSEASLLHGLEQLCEAMSALALDAEEARAENFPARHAPKGLTNTPE